MKMGIDVFKKALDKCFKSSIPKSSVSPSLRWIIKIFLFYFYIK